MMEYVPEVLVSNKGLTSATDATAALANEVVVKAIDAIGTSAIIADATGISDTTVGLQIGLVSNVGKVVNPAGTLEDCANIQWANMIQKGSVKGAITNLHKDPTQDVVTIDFGSFAPEVGHRYIIRIQRTDIIEHPGTMTYSYEYIAKTTALADMIAAFAKMINRDSRVGVIVTTTAASLVITAQAKDYKDYEKYDRVAIEVFMWYTVPSGLLASAPYELAGVTITKVAGTPGKGNAFIVNDRENAALGYRGVTYRENVVYPYIAPKLNTDLTAEYDELVVEYNNNYRSNDNQYIKSTPLSIELYSTNGACAAVKAIVDAFAAL